MYLFDLHFFFFKKKKKQQQIESPELKTQPNTQLAGESETTAILTMNESFRYYSHCLFISFFL